MEARKAAVPKFASFRPKAEDSPNPPPPRPEKVRARGHRRHHRPHEHHQPSPDPDRRPPGPSPREDPLYVVDKRGDPLIVRYGSNERSKVPAYRRSGAGRVVGAEGRLRIVYDGSRELFSLGDRLGEGPSAFRDRSLLSRASRIKTRAFRLSSAPDQKQTQPGAEELDFLPLSDSRKSRDPGGDACRGSGEEQPNYRSIQGKAKARDFVDSDLESAGSTDAEAEVDLTSPDPTRQRSIDLSRRVKECPEDVEAWLELVDLQEDLLRLSEDARLAKTGDEVKGLASVRASLLEEALSHARDKAGKETLFLRLMREGSRLWSSKALAKRWAGASLEDGSLALWRAHLDHELSSMTSFTYGGVKQLHVERLQQLRQRLLQDVRSALASHESRPLEMISPSRTDISDSLSRTYDEAVYVFTRMTCFIRDAGYLELAVAAWQAMLELTFARPADEPGTEDAAELMSAFRDFWESEVPRIGEDGAKGWRHFAGTEEMADLPEAKAEPAPALPDTGDVYRAWAAVEMQRGRGASLPARTLDDGTEEDPFRVVMFADLEPLLFLVPSVVTTLPRVRASTLGGFLLFCGLPAPSLDTGDIIRDLRNDPFVDRESARLERTGSRTRNDTEHGDRRPPRFSDPGRRLTEAPDVLFSGTDWFGFFDRDAAPEQDLALVATTQIASSFGYEFIAEFSLGLAWTKDPTAVRKVAKALLKKWPGRTSLYNAYAVAEWRNGNRAMSRNVLSSATSQDLEGKDRLWTTWAWLDVEGGDLKGALAKCMASTGISENTGAIATYSQLLRARQTLESSREFLLSVSNIQQATLHAETSSLLDYVSPCVNPADSAPSRQGDVQATMDSINAFTSEAVARGHGSSAHVERLLQFAAHLLYLHATRGPFRPTHFREQLRRFLALFPSNTIFLSLFAWADTMVIINDPVRELLRTHVLAKGHDCLTSRLFAIQHEIHAGAGSAHSARAAFECALDSDSCRGAAAGLWRSYVRFCGAHRRELRRGGVAAKEVFYRAVGACPWSKELAMEAFTTLAADMEPSELRTVWATMAAKGLRVHVDLDEFGAEWTRRRRRRG